MNTNPATPHIKQLLDQSDTHWREYQLIEKLNQLPSENFQWPFKVDNQILALFKKHFIVMNALYQLKQQYSQNNAFLHISPLEIKLTHHQPACNTDDNQLNPLTPNTHERALSEFYLNWSHYLTATPNSVNTLLSNFWKTYTAYHTQDEAYRVLGLIPPASKRDIESKYRSLAAKTHPDKGGSEKKFIEIRQAYEKLIRIAI